MLQGELARCHSRLKTITMACLECLQCYNDTNIEVQMCQSINASLPITVIFKLKLKYIQPLKKKLIKIMKMEYTGAE